VEEFDRPHPGEFELTVRAPSKFWIRFIWELTAGWLRPSFSAAFDKLPVSEMATIVRTISIGTFNGWCLFISIPPKNSEND
jgi:hypothetical protein